MERPPDNDRNGQEINQLLAKYREGRIPTLVDFDHPEEGLIDPELLNIIHSGMLSRHHIRLGFIGNMDRHAYGNRKWNLADFVVNQRLSQPLWSHFCDLLRQTERGDENCKACDRRWAARAEEQQRAIAYLCDSGLLDFAAPVRVNGQVVGALLCGQNKPMEGAVWNRELLQPNGLFRELLEGEEGVDLWARSHELIRHAEAETGLAEGVLAGALLGQVSADPAVEMSPIQAAETLKHMQVAADQISALAALKFQADKRQLENLLKEQIARALGKLKPLAGDGQPEVWAAISGSLRDIARYLGLDYAFILSCHENARVVVGLRGQAGLDEARLAPGPLQAPDEAALHPLRDALLALKDAPGPRPWAHRDFRGLAPFDWLAGRHARHHSLRGLAYRLDVPRDFDGAPQPVLIVGRFNSDLREEDFAVDDRETLKKLLGELALVVEAASLVDQLQEKSRRQMTFLQDVAHEIRSPITALLLKCEVLQPRLDAHPEAALLVRDLAANTRRLHHMSQRVWTLENLDMGKFGDTAGDERVSIYETLAKNRKALLEIAAKKEIDITIDPDIQHWEKVKVNEALFGQAVLNLMDNAVKYSSKKTNVIINGRAQLDGYTVRVGNRGIPIREEDRLRIFERYVRTIEAQIATSDGTGIGLAIVWEFARRYGAVEVLSEPIPGTKDYKTYFELYIRKG